MNEHTEAELPFLAEGTDRFRWTELAHDLQVDGALRATAVLSGDRLTETVAGPCPRCGDPITHTRIDDAVVLGAGILGDRPLDSETEPEQLTHTINVRCNCATSHPGAKPGHQGCGIAFSVSVRVVEQSRREELLSAAKRSLWKVIEQEHGGFVAEKSGSPRPGKIDIIFVRSEGSGELFAPRFQFGSDQRVRSVVLEINRHLFARSDPWGALSWWTAWNGWLGCAPVDLLGGAREAEANLAALLVTSSVS